MSGWEEGTAPTGDKISFQLVSMFFLCFLLCSLKSSVYFLNAHFPLKPKELCGSDYRDFSFL